SMLVLGDGTVLGSVSGGCVEGAVYDIAQQVLADGVAVREQFGYSDADAFAVGLTCGGELTIFIERLDPSAADLVAAVADDVAAGRPVAWVSVIGHPEDEWVGRRPVVRHDPHDGSIQERFAGHDV